jgi:hypothetical protein
MWWLMFLVWCAMFNLDLCLSASVNVRSILCTHTLGSYIINSQLGYLVISLFFVFAMPCTILLPFTFPQPSSATPPAMTMRETTLETRHHYPQPLCSCWLYRLNFFKSWCRCNMPINMCNSWKEDPLPKREIMIPRKMLGRHGMNRLRRNTRPPELSKLVMISKRDQRIYFNYTTLLFSGTLVPGV